MNNPTPFEIRKLLDDCGRAGLLVQIPSFPPETQELCFQIIEQVENDKLEELKIALQKDANQIASSANKKSGISLWVSSIACIVSVFSFIVMYCRG
ncbi:hypothetical protein [Thalassotalea sediminis]|uniref:hypothetical protein n=1 Tax=Thalassotalea sediminis TaxID=1759089 RepID=UPI002572764D|nr:hypothetical protein [Thalassotalea sediminis]